MNKKIYAVKNGKKVGIFKTWDETKALVIGYPNAQYKSFTSLEDAKEYLGLKQENKEKNNILEDEIIAYIDGSYNSTNNKVGYGGILFDSSNEYTFSEILKENYDKQRNVAGEIYASMYAIDKAISLNKKKIYIYHDYNGIRAWANGEWKTNIELTKKYKEFVKEKEKIIEIIFIKVKSHSNNKYNDIADELAKKMIY